MVLSHKDAGLNKRDTSSPPPPGALHPPLRGVLHIRPEERVPGHWRYPASPDLAPYVEWFWTVEWDLLTPQKVETLPHPSVFLLLEPGLAQIAGVSTAKFSRMLQGCSRVFGVKFRPGGFRPFVAQPVSVFTDRVFAIEEVFGEAAAGLDRRVLAHTDHQAVVAALESFLRERRPLPDDNIEIVQRIVAQIAAEPEWTRVEQVAQACDMGVRTLQRLFGEYVGVSPKWVIQRYRLHEAAARIAATETPDWADLALSLGYADQAHFIRDFKKLVGTSPADYRKSLLSRP